MSRIILSSAHLKTERIIPQRLHPNEQEKEFMNVELYSDVLNINGHSIKGITRDNKGHHYFSVTTAAVKKLRELCLLIEEQPIVLVLSEDRSIITVNSIDL